MSARDWQAYLNRMSEEPPWERAWRYRLMMSQQGFKSIRALAWAIREDHSRVARVLQILKLPERVLAAFGLMQAIPASEPTSPKSAFAS